MKKTIEMYWRKFVNKWSRKKILALRDLASCIGQFYLSKEKFDYQKASESVTALCISNLNIKGNEVIITLGRPGLLIGRKGENIDALGDYITQYYKRKITIRVKEEQILQDLIPYFEDDSDID